MRHIRSNIGAPIYFQEVIFISLSLSSTSSSSVKRFYSFPSTVLGCTLNVRRRQGLFRLKGTLDVMLCFIDSPWADEESGVEETEE